MIQLAILICLVSAFEIWSTTKRKQYRERIMVIVIAIGTILLGYFYFSNPLNRSLAKIIFGLMEKNF